MILSLAVFAVLAEYIFCSKLFVEYFIQSSFNLHACMITPQPPMSVQLWFQNTCSILWGGDVPSESGTFVLLPRDKPLLPNGFNRDSHQLFCCLLQGPGKADWGQEGGSSIAAAPYHSPPCRGLPCPALTYWHCCMTICGSGPAVQNGICHLQEPYSILCCQNVSSSSTEGQ